MSTRKITSNLRLSHWTQILRERAGSGLSVKAYCEKEGIHENTYFYWQRKIREAVGRQIIGLQTVESQENLTQPNFMEVRIEKDMRQMEPVGNGNQCSEVKIEISGARINADSEYPVDKLIKLLKGLVRV